jgi:hypothetical protein
MSAECYDRFTDLKVPFQETCLQDFWQCRLTVSSKCMFSLCFIHLQFVHRYHFCRACDKACIHLKVSCDYHLL